MICEDCQLAWKGDNPKCPQCGKGEELNNDDTTLAQSGITLRDYFAANAMQAIIIGNAHDYGLDYDDDRVAASSYKMAEEMLKERTR